MRAVIQKTPLCGTVSAPPSKSLSHRALICAAFADGISSVRGAAENEDIAATADCLRALGAELRREGDVIFVKGTGGRFLKNADLFCRESGTTLRFLMPAAALSGAARFHGTARLMERGVGVYETLFSKSGITLQKEPTEITLCGTLGAGNYEIPGGISSQFVGGMLLALSLLPQKSTLRVLPPVESRGYIDLTLDMMRRFGVTAERAGDTFTVGGGKYRASDVTVEGDYSGASYFMEAAALGADVKITGLAPDSLQGDRICAAYIGALLQGAPTLDLADCPDLAPALFCVAAAKNGGIFENTRRLRIKESDRASVMAKELARCGAKVTAEENRVIIEKSALHAPDTPLCGHGDHRVVMSLAVLLTTLGGEIEGAEAVAKSFPDFFPVLKHLQAEVSFEV